MHPLISRACVRVMDVICTAGVIIRYERAQRGALKHSFDLKGRPGRLQTDRGHTC